jgi:hypothetical protein
VEATASPCLAWHARCTPPLNFLHSAQPPSKVPCGPPCAADLWAACFRLLRVVATNCGELNAFLISLNEQRGTRDKPAPGGPTSPPNPGPWMTILSHLSSIATRNKAVLEAQPDAGQQAQAQLQAMLMEVSAPAGCLEVH